MSATSVGSLGILAEKFLADVGAVFGFEGLVFAVHALFHALEQQAGVVARQQLIPAGAPDHFDHVPAGAAEGRFQFLDDLAVAAHRAIQPLQIAVDDENQVVELLARSQRELRAQDSGSSVSPSPRKAQTLRGVGLISPRFSR